MSAQSVKNNTSVNAKFDRFVTKNEPSGDSSCPQNVRKTNNFAKSILANTCAEFVGDYNEIEEWHDFVLTDSVDT